MFRVGQEVICVIAGPGMLHPDVDSDLVLNQKYIITDIRSGIEENAPYVKVEGNIWWLSQKRFRPITNISTLQKLTKIKELEDAR